MSATAVQVREHYDSLALVYRAFWGDHLHHGLFERGDETPDEAQEKLVKLCVALAGVKGGERVLDVGCGHGATAIYLAQTHDCRVVGLTLSEKQVRIARENAAAAGVSERISFLVGDADDYDLGREQYDLVWTMESSEHFRGKAAYFCRAADALLPHGLLLLAAWTGCMQDARAQAVANAFLCPSLQTSEEYCGQLCAAGLSIVEHADLTDRVARTWDICLERSRTAGIGLRLLPAAIRLFIEGIPLILQAYRSGALRYTVIVARKESQGK